MNDNNEVIYGPESKGTACAHRPSRAEVKGRSQFNEEIIIRRLLNSLDVDSDSWALDVGCGYGNKMLWLKELGCHVKGVDVNPNLVAAARSRGLDCVTVEEFSQSEQQYDIILMAHIVEHFTPQDLLGFMDIYLDRLKIGGHIVIMTPLDHDDFYVDFDHTKTYHPSAFISVFAQPESQVQYHSRNQLKLVGFGIRRRPRRHPLFVSLYSEFNRPSIVWLAYHSCTTLFWRVAFRFSGGVLGGKTDGWAGLFEKTKQIQQ